MRHSRFEDESTELATIGHFSEDYGDEPIFKCQNCASKNPGYEEKEASLLTIIAAVICLIVFRLYSFLILPLVVESTKTIIKKCVKCDHVLDKQELLSMPSLTDKILSFKCGSCAMVISRKYALVIIAILSIIWFFIPSSPSTVVNPGGLNLKGTSWQDFVEDCGKKVVLSNQVRAKRNFDNKYANNYIEWTGVAQALITHREVANNPFVGFIVMAKMNPSDSKPQFPDIQIIFSNNIAAKYADVLKIMHVGDVFEFRGILRSMGDEFHFHDVEAVHIRPTGEKMNLEDIPELSYSGNTNMMRKGKTDSSEYPAIPAGTEKSKETTTSDEKADEKVEQTKEKTDENPTQTPSVEQTAQSTSEPVDNTPEPSNEPTDTNDQGNDQVNQGNDEPDQTTEPEPVNDNGTGDDQGPQDEPVGDSSNPDNEPQVDNQDSRGDNEPEPEPDQGDATGDSSPDTQDAGGNNV